MVLLAIVVLLPPTVVLMTLALRWQRQAIDYRDTIGSEFAAEAGFERSRLLLATGELRLAPHDSSTYPVVVQPEVVVRARVVRESNLVLHVDGTILEGPDADGADLELTGVDPDGRVVYQHRKLEIYVVTVDVDRRPTMAGVSLYGVIAKLPDGSLQTLGVRLSRRFAQRVRRDPQE